MIIAQWNTDGCDGISVSIMDGWQRMARHEFVGKGMEECLSILKAYGDDVDAHQIPRWLYEEMPLKFASLAQKHGIVLMAVENVP